MMLFANFKDKNFFLKSMWLFVCLGFIIPLENFSLVWRHHHCRWRTANFDLCSALMAIEQWGFFNLPHLLWHRASIYNGHLGGPVTLTPFAEHLAEELSRLGLSRLDSNTQPSACGVNALTHCCGSMV